MAKLYFYFSTMNAGKTTTLLQSDYNYRERGMNTILYTPQLDDRYGRGKIVSRIGLEKEAVAFKGDDNLFVMTKKTIQSLSIQCVLVDEAQFLSKEQVLQLTDIVDVLKIPVLAYGIRTDFSAEPFEGSKYLFAWAENLVELKTICHCGKKATHVLRVNEKGQAITEGEQIVIGGNECYISVCRIHFKAKDIPPFTSSKMSSHASA